MHQKEEREGSRIQRSRANTTADPLRQLAISISYGVLSLVWNETSPDSTHVAFAYERITRGAARCRSTEGRRSQDKDARGAGRKPSRDCARTEFPHSVPYRNVKTC